MIIYHGEYAELLNYLQHRYGVRIEKADAEIIRVLAGVKKEA